MTRLINFGFASCLLFSAPSYSVQETDPFKEFDSKIDQLFNEETQRVDDIFDAVNQAIDRAYKGLTKKIEVKWPDGALPDRKQWVTYSNDFSMRAKVDYDEGELVLEAIIKDEADVELITSNLASYGLALVTAKPKELDNQDSLLNEIRNELPSNMQEIEEAKPEKVNLLALVIDTDKLVEINQQQTTDSVQAEVASKDTEKHANKSTPTIEEKGIEKIQVVVPFVNGFQKLLLQEYQNDIATYSEAYQTPISIILAIIETESSFNPRAVSPVPAFGLMQLVPTTAGVDAYSLVYGEKQVVSPSYLFDEKNNLELGSAYFYLLTNRYLSGIESELSKFYCAVASYNTGIGNLARVFTGEKRIQPAVEKINSMSPEKVYEYLLNNLPAAETRHYLEKIVSRREKYLEYDI